MSKIKKPFRRGKCRLCRSEENRANQRLCDRCFEYVWQDTAFQREFPHSDEFVENQQSCASNDDCWCGSLSKTGDPRLMNRVLGVAKLTHSQKKIMKLYFVECLNLSEIAEELGIVKQTVFERYSQAVKKLQKHQSIVHIVKGKNKKPDSNSIENESALPLDKYPAPLSCKKDLQKLTIDPYQYYSCCPRCGHSDFHAVENTGKCMKCGWAFRVHTVDEVLASNSWPDEWIQKKYFSGPFIGSF
jgi:predicted DNA-binding protein YlxM (UPF0122 family)